jgi:hypothetical protein
MLGARGALRCVGVLSAGAGVAVREFREFREWDR